MNLYWNCVRTQCNITSQVVHRAGFVCSNLPFGAIVAQHVHAFVCIAVLIWKHSSRCSSGCSSCKRLHSSRCSSGCSSCKHLHSSRCSSGCSFRCLCVCTHVVGQLSVLLIMCSFSVSIWWLGCVVCVPSNPISSHGPLPRRLGRCHSLGGSDEATCSQSEAVPRQPRHP